MPRATDVPRRRRPVAPADPQRAAFSAFLERDEYRERRRKGKRRTIFLSIAVHVVALLTLVGLSVWQVDELWKPSVRVRMFSGSSAPAAARPEILLPP